MLADIGTLPGEVRERVERVGEKGGVLVRFAGPRLEKGGDDLLAGGAAARRAHARRRAVVVDAAAARCHSATRPVRGACRRRAEVLVTRQVLADPAALGAGREGLGAAQGRHAARHGRQARRRPDRVLPRHRQLRLVEPAAVGPVRGDAAADRQPGQARRRQGTGDRRPRRQRRRCHGARCCRPLQVLDGFGLLKNPPPTTQGIAAAKIAEAKPNAENPPGYYGPAGAPRALNLMTPKSLLKPLPGLPAGVERRAYEGDAAQPAQAAAAALAHGAAVCRHPGRAAAADGRARCFGRRAGAQDRARPSPSLAHRAGAPGCWSALPASAQAPRRRSLRPGDARRASRPPPRSPSATCYGRRGHRRDKPRRASSGSASSSSARTAVEPGEPYAVNIVNDEIAFFPILYWPVLAQCARRCPSRCWPRSTPT